MSSSDLLREILENAAKQSDAMAKSLLNLPEPIVTIPRSLPPPRVLRPTDRMAETIYEDTKSLIEDAQSKLTDGQELALIYAGAGGFIRVSDIGCYNPSLMVVWGTDLEGNDSSIVVHISSFALRLAVAEVSKETPRIQIGFVAPPRSEEES